MSLLLPLLLCLVVVDLGTAWVGPPPIMIDLPPPQWDEATPCFLLEGLLRALPSFRVGIALFVCWTWMRDWGF